jgi:transaldolase / glucose-6-phosphate isomerase
VSATSIPAQTLALGDLAPAVDAQLAEWERAEFGRRLWEKDPTLWSPEPFPPELADRLGWLDLATAEPEPDITRLAARAAAEDIRHVVLLGMGGSSLAPEVFSRAIGSGPGRPALLVLDSTHPGAVRSVRDTIDPRHTWFLVSSKSGTTLETLSFFHFFWDATSQVTDEPGSHFVAVTDPDTPLQHMAEERGFAAVVSTPSDVGGRYSALTPFGMLPAALIGAGADRLLASAADMARAAGPEVPVAENPGLVLGAVIGIAALGGRDKLTLVVSPQLEAFPVWLEQLVAESTGKEGKGIVPVAGEDLGAPEIYGDDRLFVYLSLDHDDGEERVAALESAGHPVVTIHLDETADLGAEMLRAEIAVSAAGSVLGIHPFDQPDVQLAKDLAKRAMAGELPQGETPTAAPTDDAALREWAGSIGASDYVALQAFLAPTDELEQQLQQLRMRLRDRHRVATTVGWGPRFLHSTGQLHKGGPASVVAMQLTDTPSEDLDVPELGFTFGRLLAGQADGDLAALVDRKRRAIRVDLGDDAEGGLAHLVETLDG